MNKLSGVLLCVRAMNEVVRRPWARELHTALFQLLRGRSVLVLVSLYGFVVDQMGDIQKHLA